MTTIYRVYRYIKLEATNKCLKQSVEKVYFFTCKPNWSERVLHSVIEVGVLNSFFAMISNQLIIRIYRI